MSQKSKELTNREKLQYAVEVKIFPPSKWSEPLNKLTEQDWIYNENDLRINRKISLKLKNDRRFS